MRCLTCQDLSFDIICKSCQDRFLSPTFHKRELEKDFFVYSFYKFEEIKELLNTKYQFYGDKVFSLLAKQAFTKFSKEFSFTNKIYAIPIDDNTRHQFSQTAILTKALDTPYIKPLYNILKATNIVKYAGKSLEYRRKNMRNFVYKGKENIQVILIDDLVTTGLTIIEAKRCLEKSGCEVLFALTLSDAKNP